MVFAGLTATALTGIGLIALSIGLIGIGIFLLFKKGESNQKNIQAECSNSNHLNHETTKEHKNKLNQLRSSQGMEPTANPIDAAEPLIERSPAVNALSQCIMSRCDSLF